MSARSGDRVDFRGSSGKHYCKFCNAWIDGNPIALKHHREGNRHKRNVQAAMDRQRRDKMNEEKRKRREAAEVSRMQREAGIRASDGSVHANRSAARAPGEGPSRSHKQNICFAFQRGDCRHGSTCKFSHEVEGGSVASSSQPSKSTAAIEDAKGKNSMLKQRDYGTGREGEKLARLESQGNEQASGDEGSDAELDEDERRGIYEVDGRIYLEAARHPEKIVPGLAVEIAVGAEFDSDEEDEEDAASPWAKAVVAQVLVLCSDASNAKGADQSIQWRYRVRITEDDEDETGADETAQIRDALLEDMRVPVAPPPPPVDLTNRGQIDDAELLLKDRSTNTGIGGWEVVPSSNGGDHMGGSDSNKDESRGSSNEMWEDREQLQESSEQRTEGLSSAAGSENREGVSDREEHNSVVAGGDSANSSPGPASYTGGRNLEGGRSYAGFKLTAANPTSNLLGSGGGLGALGGPSDATKHSAVSSTASATFKKRKKRRKKR